MKMRIIYLVLAVLVSGGFSSLALADDSPPLDATTKKDSKKKSQIEKTGGPTKAQKKGS